MADPDEDQSSYIDYETFLDPGFDPHQFANSLVLATNDPNDAPLDLSTPLSRVLFDIQEIDSHIDMLTARSAVPLLTHTKDQTQMGTRIIADLEPQIKSLNDSYKQLEREVIQKHAEADEIRQVALNLWEALRLGRAVGRCLQLGRQLEVQHAELVGSPSSGGPAKNEDHRALVRCAHTILALREMLLQKAPTDEGYGLERVDVIRHLQESVVVPMERSVRESAERIVREFSLGAVSSNMTFAQSEEAKARTVSALLSLYLLSPTVLSKNETWTPTLLLQALEGYLRASLQSSLTALARSLASLPTLDRTLGEVSARCQNVVALAMLLESTKAPAHPLRAILTISPSAAEHTSLLQPLLARLETGSLPSYFWRTLAGSLSPRVQDILNRGGVAARTLRSNKNSVSDAIREAVLRGMQPPSALAGGSGKGRGKPSSDVKGPSWEREIAVMVGSVAGHLGR